MTDQSGDILNGSIVCNWRTSHGSEDSSS